jgi:hypothetical protein
MSFRAIPYKGDLTSADFLHMILAAPLIAQRITRRALQERAELEEPPDGYWALDPSEWNAIKNALPTDLTYEPQARYVGGFLVNYIRNRLGPPVLYVKNRER